MDVTKKRLESLLEEPHMSVWFKMALKTALERDPFEAVLDAELLFRVLKDRENDLYKRIITDP